MPDTGDQRDGHEGPGEAGGAPPPRPQPPRRRPAGTDAPWQASWLTGRLRSAIAGAEKPGAGSRTEPPGGNRERRVLGGARLDQFEVGAARAGGGSAFTETLREVTGIGAELGLVSTSGRATGGAPGERLEPESSGAIENSGVASGPRRSGRAAARPAFGFDADRNRWGRRRGRDRRPAGRRLPAGGVELASKVTSAAGRRSERRPWSRASSAPGGGWGGGAVGGGPLLAPLRRPRVDIHALRRRRRARRVGDRGQTPGGAHQHHQGLGSGGPPALVPGIELPRRAGRAGIPRPTGPSRRGC